MIVNLLAATAATQAEKQNDSSEDENEESWHDIDVRAGDLDVVHNTLAGIAKRSSDEGKQALGRHARTIRLGRSLWQSAPLTTDETKSIQERHFQEGTFPPIKQMKKQVDAIKNTEESRPAPFACQTKPFAHLHTKDYSSLLTTWFHAVSNEKVAPTSQQLEVLHNTKDRILLELRLEKEGILLPKAHPERAAAEEPLRGFVHGSPGTGKASS